MISAFLEYTKNVNAPEVFRLWSAIAMIGGVCERRLWITLRGNDPIYPNQFVLLVARPGIGKSEAMKKVTRFWHCIKDLKIAPDTMTKAALVDRLLDSKRIVNCGKDGFMEYHSLQIPSREFGNLVPSYDMAFMNVLNDLFDCPPHFSEQTRGGGEIFIPDPQINILGCTQPSYLSVMMPDQAWGLGFTARTLLIFSDQELRSSLFQFTRPHPDLHQKIAGDLKQIMDLHGEFTWTPECAKLYDEWYMGGCKPVPDIPRLEHYLTRRHIHTAKLMMIASLARSNGMVIESQDFVTARGWLLAAESKMPDIFRAMVLSGDSAVLSDAVLFFREFEAQKGRGLLEREVINFLRTRIKQRDVLNAVEILKQAGMIVQIGYDPKGRVLYSANVGEEPKPPTAQAASPSIPDTDGRVRYENPKVSAPARYILRVPTEDDDEEEYYDEDELNY